MEARTEIKKPKREREREREREKGEKVEEEILENAQSQCSARN